MLRPVGLSGNVFAMAPLTWVRRPPNGRSETGRPLPSTMRPRTMSCPSGCPPGCLPGLGSESRELLPDAAELSGGTYRELWSNPPRPRRRSGIDDDAAKTNCGTAPSMLRRGKTHSTGGKRFKQLLHGLSGTEIIHLTASAPSGMSLSGRIPFACDADIRSKLSWRTRGELELAMAAAWRRLLVAFSLQASCARRRWRPS